MKHLYENWSCKIFPGFYYSNIDGEDELNNIAYNDGVADGYSIDWKDYKQYEKEVCKEWVNAISDNFEDNPLELQILDYSGLRSSREYNFSTDKISFYVNVNLNKLKKYCWVDNQEDFNKYLHDNFTSYSGFCSFTANNLHSFKEDYYSENGYYKESYTDIMIEYYLLKNVNFILVEQDVCESISGNCIAYEYSCLYKNDDHTYWDFEYDEKKGLIPTEQIA